MLTDPTEIAIISKAQQKNVREPGRSREHFERIFADFIDPEPLKGQLLLDLGPGQYDFSVLARQRGATTHSIDKDPAVLELGRYKGLDVIEGDLKRLSAADFPERYDGVFCKFSINAFWFHDDLDAHAAHVNDLCSLLKPDGWAWIAPWNGVPKKADLKQPQIDAILKQQAELFRGHGFDGYDLGLRLSYYYGVHGDTGNRAVFVRNLRVPPSVASCTRL